MDEALQRLATNMIRTERSSRVSPATKALIAICDQFTKAGALGHGRYPVMLDEASASEYEDRAKQWLKIIVRVAAETNAPWTKPSAQIAQHIIEMELATDWDEIFGRMRQMVGQSLKPRMDVLDAARDRSRAHLEQELGLLVLKQDRTKLPLSDRLSADRYRAVVDGWRKAHAYLDAGNPDLGNAAKEAVGAVETLARLVVNDPTATLGEAIKVLRSTGRVEAPLLKGIEELWGWSSAQPGIRHSSADGSIDLAEVRYCFRLAEAALHLLLAKDAA